LIYIAHANIAYNAGCLVYAASCRDLAERAGVSHTTATRSTWRLVDKGLLIPNKKAVADCSNVFQLGNLDIPLHFPRTPSVRKCNTLFDHDAFRYAGLGKSAGQVWSQLQEHPKSIDELVKATGRHPKTIERAIDRMSNLADPLTGEFLPMVASEDGVTYHALPVDLDRIARAVGTAGTGERQHIEHAKERRIHSMSLLRGRKSKSDFPSTSGGKEDM
jgi:predicted transcriptional regulator